MESPFKSKNGLERIAKALGYSLAGLKAAYKNEAAIRQETWLMVVFIPLAFYFFSLHAPFYSIVLKIICWSLSSCYLHRTHICLP